MFLPQTQLLCLPKGLVASSGQAHYDPQNSAFSSKGGLLQKRKSRCCLTNDICCCQTPSSSTSCSASRTTFVLCAHCLKGNANKLTVSTSRLVVEEVVVLRDVGDDAETVRHFHGHHVFWVQQGWDPQLCLCHIKGLRGTKDRRGRYVVDRQ